MPGRLLRFLRRAEPKVPRHAPKPLTPERLLEAVAAGSRRGRYRPERDLALIAAASVSSTWLRMAPSS